MRLARVVPLQRSPSYNPDFCCPDKVWIEKHVGERNRNPRPRIGLAVLVPVFPVSGCLIPFLRARLNTQVDDTTDVDAYTGAPGF
jgi:hypothetical protein